MATFMGYFSHNDLNVLLVKFCTIVTIGAKNTNVECFVQSLFLLNHPVCRRYAVVTTVVVQHISQVSREARTHCLQGPVF